MSDFAAPSNVLSFLALAGVDVFLEEDAVNRLVAPIIINKNPINDGVSSLNGGVNSNINSDSIISKPATSLQVSSMSVDDAAVSANNLAKSAPDLASLAEIMESFDGCSLKRTASRLVFSDGVPGSRLMIIGEAPGKDEDEIGRPFVGKAGQLLDKMLKFIGLDRQSVYIANIVPWRPPGNRTPTPQEIAICLPFIKRQIELSNPEFILTLGAPASQTLLNQKDGILRLRGKWFEYVNGEKNIPTIATLHPAYLLRQPAQKALAWRDFCALCAKIRE